MRGWFIDVAMMPRVSEVSGISVISLTRLKGGVSEVGESSRLSNCFGVEAASPCNVEETVTGLD